MKYLLVACLAFCACNSKTEVKENVLLLGDTYHSHTVREFEYKGCEYIAFGEGQGLAATHKGNCKYCQERNK